MRICLVLQCNTTTRGGYSFPLIRRGKKIKTNTQSCDVEQTLKANLRYIPLYTLRISFFLDQCCICVRLSLLVQRIEDRYLHKNVCDLCVCKPN